LKQNSLLTTSVLFNIKSTLFINLQCFYCFVINCIPYISSKTFTFILLQQVSEKCCFVNGWIFPKIFLSFVVPSFSGTSAGNASCPSRWMQCDAWKYQEVLAQPNQTKPNDIAPCPGRLDSSAILFWEHHILQLFGWA